MSNERLSTRRFTFSVDDFDTEVEAGLIALEGSEIGDPEIAMDETGAGNMSAGVSLDNTYRIIGLSAADITTLREYDTDGTLVTFRAYGHNAMGFTEYGPGTIAGVFETGRTTEPRRAATVVMHSMRGDVPEDIMRNGEVTEA